MPERFEREPDLSRGEWLRPMEAEAFGSILSVVPRGFEAYARIFHPVERDRPHETKSWLDIDEETYFDGFDDIGAALETDLTTWTKTAESFDTTMHATAQYARLVRRDYGEEDGAIAADGWRYCGTSEGCLDAASLAAVVAVLARHTSTPEAGIAAIWEGWCGLLSAAGIARYAVEESNGFPSRSTDDGTALDIDHTLPERLTASARHWMGGTRSMLEALRRYTVFESKPGSGLLPRDAASGPFFELQEGAGRRYVLFEAGANDFADATWPGSAPWVDEDMWAQSPSILWPDDHSWLLATEIDFDSTLVAGTTALIHELTQTPGLEVLAIRTDADLSSDGDVLNRHT